MPGPRFVAALLLTGLLCAGCTNVSLLTAQQELDELIEVRDAGFARNPDRGWATARDVAEPELAKLADEALERSGDQDLDERTRLSFLRIATTAAWKAGESGKDSFVTATEAGTRTCKALLARNSAPPRDCAFLLVVHAFQWHDLQVGQVDQWSVDRFADPAGLARQGTEIRNLAGKYYPNTLGFLAGRADAVAEVPGLDPTFCQYLKRQADVFKRHILLLQKIAVEAQKNAPEDAELETFVDEDEARTRQALDDIRNERYWPSTCQLT